MDLPDVIGYTLDEALSEIKIKGYVVEEVFVTKPLKAAEPLGLARVVRLDLIHGVKLRVVVAYHDYGKGGVH